MRPKKLGKISLLILSLISAFWIFGIVEINKNFHDDSLDQLKIFIGDWKNEKTLESWTQISEKTFEGFMLESFENDTISYEELRIVSMLDGIYYLAKTKQNTQPIPFKLNEDPKLISNYIYKFENQQHDFPKFIQYKFDKDSLHIVIGDSIKKLKFEFIKN